MTALLKRNKQGQPPTPEMIAVTLDAIRAYPTLSNEALAELCPVSSVTIARLRREHHLPRLDGSGEPAVMKRYSAEQKQAMAVYAAQQRRARKTFKCIAGELGISLNCLFTLVAAIKVEGLTDEPITEPETEPSFAEPERLIPIRYGHAPHQMLPSKPQGW